MWEAEQGEEQQKIPGAEETSSSGKGGETGELDAGSGSTGRRESADDREGEENSGDGDSQGAGKKRKLHKEETPNSNSTKRTRVTYM